MKKNKYDIWNDMCEIRELFEIMSDAHSYCEQNNKKTFHIIRLIKIIEDKLNTCVDNYDIYISNM